MFSERVSVVLYGLKGALSPGLPGFKHKTLACTIWGKTMQCPTGGGAGFVYSTVTCSSCGGSGVIVYTDENGDLQSRTCDSCMGAGVKIESETCSTCGGSGEV
jgi:DnaJ-class molecular chaperone